MDFKRKGRLQAVLCQSCKAFKKYCLKGLWDNFYDIYNLLLELLLLLWQYKRLDAQGKKY